MKYKIGFVTCVQLGLSCVEEIYKLGGKLEVIFTLQDDIAQKKSGRIYLDEFVQRNSIPLMKVKNINDAKVIDVIKKKDLDWLFIIGWSQIAKKELLEAPKVGCIGMHPTLLPKGRGRASIPWAILKQLPETGVTMFKLDTGVDTGDIIGQEIIPLSVETTATQLYEQMNQAHITLISRYWTVMTNKNLELKAQNEADATEWKERRPEDGEISKSMSVNEALLLIRAVTHPYPGAFMFVDGIKHFIWSAVKSEWVTKYEVSDGYIQPLEYTVEKPDGELRYEKKEKSG